MSLLFFPIVKSAIGLNITCSFPVCSSWCHQIKAIKQPSYIIQSWHSGFWPQCFILPLLPTNFWFEHHLFCPLAKLPFPNATVLRKGTCAAFPSFRRQISIFLNIIASRVFFTKRSDIQRIPSISILLKSRYHYVWINC